MRSIIVVCLSPAIDRNYILPELVAGSLHRCDNPVLSPGGKGVNVARILSLLGATARCIGFFAGQNGQFIVRNLQQHNVLVDAILLKGETRSSLNILDTSSGKETEILEAGPVVYQNDKDCFIERFKLILAHETLPPIVIFSGGIPVGLDPSFYNELISLAKGYKADCILDSSGDALANGVKAKPFMIKPNRRELAYITDYMIDINSEINSDYMRDIFAKTRRLEIPLIAVTLGGAGALLCVENILLYAHPVELKAVNTIGSGDCFTAGMAYSIANGFTWKKALELSVACASSNALFEQVGFIDLEQVKEFQSKIRVDEYDLKLK